MKKNAFTSLCYFMLFACCGCTYDSNVEPCLEAKFEEFKDSPRAVSIQKQVVDGEKHYWFNTNARHTDGIEYILSATCDTVCYYLGDGGPVPCEANYVYDNWEVVWEK